MYYSISLKKKGATKGILVPIMADNADQAFKIANDNCFGSVYFPDKESIKAIDAKKYHSMIETINQSYNTNNG